MGKPINKSETDQRDVMTILREENPVGYAAMMKRETIQPRVEPPQWEWVPHFDEAKFQKLTNRIARTGREAPRTMIPAGGVVDEALKPLPLSFARIAKEKRSTAYKIEPFRWEPPADAEVERVQIGNAKMNVVADPTLPRDACYTIGVDYGVASSGMIAVFSTDDRGEIHYVSPDGEKTKITSGEAVRSGIHNDEVCGEPYCWCNRTHTDE